MPLTLRPEDVSPHSPLRDRWLARVAEHEASVKGCESELSAAKSQAERESMSIRLSRAREQERFWRLPVILALACLAAWAVWGMR